MSAIRNCTKGSSMRKWISFSCIPVGPHSNHNIRMVYQRGWGCGILFNMQFWCELDSTTKYLESALCLLLSLFIFEYVDWQWGTPYYGSISDGCLWRWWWTPGTRFRVLIIKSSHHQPPHLPHWSENSHPWTSFEVVAQCALPDILFHYQKVTAILVFKLAIEAFDSWLTCWTRRSMRMC